MIARLVSLALLIALVIVIPLSHTAMSKKAKKKGRAKVSICHFSACDCADPTDDLLHGHVIRVSRRALAAHLAKHGDCTEFVRETNESGREICRCLTCQELCAAALESCQADCPPCSTTPMDPCLADCQQAFQMCLTGCDG